ncbi:MAG: hypothetical protein KC609_10355 [Myxococcales bacterium]|nr:hypothetical protein [Myxococcales bacterium]
MNRDVLLIATLAFLAGIIVSRYLGERSYRHLGDGQKAMMFAQFRRFRIWQLVPTGSVLIAFLLLLDHPSINRRTLTVVTFATLVVIAVGQSGYVWFRLKRLRFPLEFLREFAVSRVVQLAGLLIFCSLLLWQILGR